MEGELIIVTFISSIFGLIGLTMLNNNWFKRQKCKYDYQLKRAKLSRKISAPVQEEPGAFDNLKTILPLLKGLDSDQIGALADRFLGGGEEIIETGGGGLLDNIPKPLIDAFMKGITDKSKDQHPAQDQVPDQNAP